MREREREFVHMKETACVYVRERGDAWLFRQMDKQLLSEQSLFFRRSRKDFVSFMGFAALAVPTDACLTVHALKKAIGCSNEALSDVNKLLDGCTNPG